MVKGDGVNRKQPRERGVLIGVLSSLVVLIIGLVVIIVVNAINADDEMSSNICGGDNLSDIYGCIYSDKENDEDVLAKYDGTIDDLVISGDYIGAANLIMSKVYYLLQNYDCMTSLEYLNNVDMNDFSDSSILFIASRAVGFCDICGDENSKEKWNNIVNEKALNVQEGYGF